MKLSSTAIHVAYGPILHPTKVAGEAHEYSEARVLSFAAEVRAAAAELLSRGAAEGAAGGRTQGSGEAADGVAAAPSPEELQPCVYFLPGAHAQDCRV